MTKSSPKKGTIRKSRRRRLPTSSGTWGMDFAPSDFDWRKIENAYGRAWDGEARGEIVALVKEYLLYEPFERNAPFVDDALTWISRVERHARAFWNATHDSHSHKAKMIREAAWAAEFAIVDNLTTLLLANPTNGES